MARFLILKTSSYFKNFISRLTAKEVYERALKHAKEYDLEFAELLMKYSDYSIKIFNIERERENPRKDYVTFGKIKDEVWYMYDELFTGDLDYKFKKINNPEEIKTILKTFITEYYNEEDDQPTWFAKIKEMSSKLGYAAEMKEYRKNPDAYKGNVADVTTVIRVALTTRDMTPNLYDIIQLLGRERMEKRFQRFY